MIISLMVYPAKAVDIQNNIVNNTIENNSSNTTNVLENSTMQNNVDELQKTHDELQGQVDESNNELLNIQNDLSENMTEIESLNEKLLEYQTQIDKNSIQVNNLSESIKNIEEELNKVEKEYEEKKKALENRLVILYEIGDNKYLDVLLSSTSIGDFLSRYYLITEIAKYDSQIVEEVEKQKIEIEESRKKLNSQMEEYKKAKDEEEKIQIMLENTLIVKNNYISKLTQKEQELQAKIEESINELRLIEKEIVMLTTANIGTDYVGGVMAWPVPGYTRITSQFGMRTHPITGVYKLHTGMDIGAPIGTNFIAANDGVVIKAGFNTAYGNMVIIDHGGGVSTLYAHGSEILVTLGQEVKKGDPILKVGMTGYTTGPHAHFEVRVNGEYVQPLNFVQAN